VDFVNEEVIWLTAAFAQVKLQVCGEFRILLDIVVWVIVQECLNVPGQGWDASGCRNICHISGTKIPA
jgi:hypothetical protein